ncbi:MAG: type II toxin-antitoxin system HigA family antitoxin [Candidatus Obscuribacterales bacterium]
MTSAVLNESKYKKLISQHPPRVIETEADYDRSLALVNELMVKSNCTAEETELLKLMVLVVAAYEEKLNLFPGEVDPVDMLKHLMDANDHTQKDLWPIADKAIISKVLSGERAISKSLAKRLADFYNVSVSVFV